MIRKATCHPDQKYYAKDLCKSCWSKAKYEKQYKSQRRAKRTMDDLLVFRHRQARHRASERGIEFSITIDDVRKLYADCAGKCAISGRVLENSDGPNALSLDRIDNASGYVPGNIRLVIWAVNLAMHTWGTESFLALCRDVAAQEIR